MYSGSDSTESQNFPQWAMNPSTYQNMANDQVDWAALAQQWIIMKEAGPPPVPGEQPVPLNKKKPKQDFSPERGEAPMDMEDKDDSPSWPGPPKVASNEWGWNNQNTGWNNSWNNQWNGPPHGVPPPNVMMKPPLLPTPNNYNELSAPPESSSDNAVPFAGTAQINDYPPVHWSDSRVIKPRNKRFSKINVPTTISAPTMIPVAPPVADTQTLDAAKRKSLPAWIREGLEKMERDKMKQLEKEKEKFEREVFHEKIKQTEKEKMEILKTTMQEQQKSKFDSDGEISEEEEEESQSQEKNYPYKPEPVLTQEELMLKVRRTMTEVLLKVTNAEIATIVKEESLRWMKKLKASDHRSSAPNGANITAKLGLGMYGEGSDSSSEDSEDEYLKEKRDSDSELKDIIRKKVSDFSRTEREIEEKLAEAESKKGGFASRDSSPDSSANESQVDARSQGRRKKSNDRTPPHTKQRSVSSVSSDSHSPAPAKIKTRQKSKSSRRSSSSSESAHSKRSRAHSKRSRSRSRTPKKSHKHSKSSRSRRSRSRERKRRRSRSRSRSYSSRSRRSYSKDSRYSKERYSKRSRTRSRSRSSHRSSKRRRSRSGSHARGKRSHRY